MAALVAQTVFDVGIEALREIAVHAAAAFARWAESGYARAPTVMIGIAAAAMVPLLWLLGYIINRLAAGRQPPPEEPATIRTELAAAQGLGWPCDGWIIVDGAEPMRRAIPRELLSIGREDDNELQLDDTTVHRHHAVLQRTPEAQFVIRDLSGDDGNGVTVNGTRVRQAALNDGDTIGIGLVMLRFESRPT